MARSAGGGVERANYQIFIGQLVAALGAPPPEAGEAGRLGDYQYEAPVPGGARGGGTGFIDLYKRNCAMHARASCGSSTTISMPPSPPPTAGAMTGRGGDLAPAEIVARLVALNAERAAEEAAGHVRWLRPEYQVPLFDKKRRAKGTPTV